MPNALYCGDNLQVMRSQVPSGSIDLCYIDPPFHSRRNYSLVYPGEGESSPKGSPAFADTWTWGGQAASDFESVVRDDSERKTARLMEGLRAVLGESGMLAYLASLAIRILEIHRVLKRNGSFYLHCDPTASHYLKLVVDTVFLPRGGEFRNEIIWAYRTGGVSDRWFGRKHDVILYYSRSRTPIFNVLKEKSYLAHRYGFKNVTIETDERGWYTMTSMRDVWDIAALRGNQPETVGYPTQKPRALIERIIAASSNAGDMVLDAYCGSGTTIAVAQAMGRNWIGIDNSRLAIDTTTRRLRERFDGIECEPVWIGAGSS